MRNLNFYAGIISFLIGVLISSFYAINFSLVVFIIFLGVCIVLFQYFSKNDNKIFLIPIIVIFCGLGMLRMNAELFHKGDGKLDELVGEKTEIQGIVIDEPLIKNDNQAVTLKVSNDANVLVTAPEFPKMSYGDKISVLGKLKKPESFVGDNGSVFDYPSYLAKDHIFYTESYVSIKIISSGNGNPVKSFLFKIKNFFLEKVEEEIPKPYAEFMEGLIISGKRSLDQNLQDEFKRAGVIHIVVLSGYNITVVAETISKIFSFLPLTTGYLFGVIGIILFSLMAGGTSTVIRALIMALIVILGKMSGRQYDVMRALFFTLFIMVLIQPRILLYDVSFQLSFLATYGVIITSPMGEKYFWWITKKYDLRQLIASTVLTEFFLLPYLMYQVGQISSVSLFTNLLILPLVPLTMLLGFLTGMIGMVSSFISYPFAFLSYLLLYYELSVVHFFASLPLASFIVSNFSLWLLGVWYLFYGIIIYKYSFKKPIQKGHA